MRRKVTPHQKTTIAKYAAEHLFQIHPVISVFSEAMMPVTIHTCARACWRIFWQCLYILGFSLAGTTELDLTVNRECFPAN